MQTNFHRMQADLYSALSNPTRLRILELLQGGELTVGRLQQELGSDGSSVSQQLSILRARQLVDHRRVGTKVYYSAGCDGIDELLMACKSVVRQQVDLVRNSVPL